MTHIYNMDYNTSDSNNNSLVEYLEETVGLLTNKSVRNAFTSVDRALFVPDDYKSEAYEDYAIPITKDRVVPKPAMVAFVLEKLDVKDGNTILDVGSGSGWMTALLAYCVGLHGRVIGVEHVSDIATCCQSNLSSYDLPHISIKNTDIYSLDTDIQQFDRIHVSLSVDTIPDTLTAKLKNDGRMSIPINNTLTFVRKEDTTVIIEDEYPGFSFTSLY